MVLIPIEVNDIEADMNLVSVSICVVPYNVKGFTKGNDRNIKDNEIQPMKGNAVS